MKILLVHNFYGSGVPSGENMVFEAEKTLLEEHGHTVHCFTRHSDEIRCQGFRGVLMGALSVPWNPFAASTLRKVVEDFKPDVVHVHNTFPLISPAIFRAIGKSAASVLTLHNYRLLCPAAIPMRDGQVCTACIDQKSVQPALRHGCYRGSRVATLPLAMNVALHRVIGTWKHGVDAFITLSDFQRRLMAEGGLPAAKIHVKPNFYAGNQEVVPFTERPGYVVFVGRMGEEKGVRTLIKAWKNWGASAPELRMIGDGPIREKLQRQVEGLPVRFLGQISAEAAREQIAHARLLVLPSECFETFGLVVIEAFAFGTPVAVSNMGALPSIVQHGLNGVAFEAGSPSSLLANVQPVLANLSQLATMAGEARKSFEKHYNKKVNYQMLMEIYEQALEVNKRLGT